TTVIRKPLRPLPRDEARATSIRLCRSWPVLDLTVRTYLDAVRGVTEHRLAYWDALVWATARQNNIPYILTEDQQHGRLVEDVRYFDPFAPGFDMAMLS
ncbi:MAG TPA: PIN domain-containing protein, partial [Dehalococcoidia bacterium]|nr:PIN domain-containing protein [Dehalococcoidia bacterium]